MPTAALTTKITLAIAMSVSGIDDDKTKIKKYSITGTTQTLQIDHIYYLENEATARNQFAELAMNLYNIFLGTFDDLHVTKEEIIT